MKGYLLLWWIWPFALTFTSFYRSFHSAIWYCH